MSELTIDITCPVCNKVFKKKALDLKKGAIIKCPGCGEQTTIRDDYFTDMAKNLKKGS